MNISEMVRVIHENDLFDTFPECSKVVHILAAIVILGTGIQSVPLIEDLPL